MNPTGITPSPGVAAAGPLYGANTSAGGTQAPGSPININGSPTTVTNVDQPRTLAPGVTNVGGSSANQNNTTATVVTPQAANTDLSKIATHTAQITQGISQQAQTNAANNSTTNTPPTIDGYNVGTVSSGQQGELTIQGANGQTFYANPVGGSQQSTSVGDVLNGMVNGSNSSPLETSVGNFASKTFNNLNDQANVYSQYQQQMNQLMSGVFPLNTAEQALVDSTNASFQTLETQQQLQNTNVQAGTQELANVTGIARYAPEIAAGELSAAVNSGLTKIAALETQRVQAVAKLQEGFQTQDLNMIQDAYQSYTDYTTQKQGALKDINDAASQAIEYTQTAAATAAKNAFDENMQSQTFDLTKAQDYIDDGLRQGQLSVAEAQLAQTKIDDNLKNTIDAYNAGLISNPGSFNPATGSFTTPTGEQGTSPTSIPGYTTLPNGSPIVQHPNGDAFVVSSSGALTKIPSANIAPLTEAATAISTVQSLQGLYQNIMSTQGLGQQQAIAQYNAGVASLPSYVQSIAPTIPSGGIFSGMGTSIGNDFSGNTFESSGMTQFGQMVDTLNSKMSGLAPSMPIPIAGQSFPTASAAYNWFKSTGQLNAWNTLKQTPGVNENNITQVINTGELPTQTFNLSAS